MIFRQQKVVFTDRDGRNAKTFRSLSHMENKEKQTIQMYVRGFILSGRLFQPNILWLVWSIWMKLDFISGNNLNTSFRSKMKKTRGTNTNKERLRSNYYTILCCVSMDVQKIKLLAIGKIKNPQCFNGVKNLPVEYTANSNAQMTK